MSFWSAITGGLIGDIGKAIDDNVTSDEERLTLRNELEGIISKREEMANEAEKALQGELTKRHQADMQSDSKLAKNVRPGVLIAMTLLTFVYLFIGLFVEIGPVKLDLYKAGLEALFGLDAVVFGFYFSSRGVEKAAKSIGKLLIK